MHKTGKGRPTPYLVSHVTGSLLLTLLAIIMALCGGLALFRLGQRLVWLLFDFRPLGFAWETLLLVVTNGLVFAGNLVTLLMSIAVLRLRFGRARSRGRMLYTMEKLLSVLYVLGLLLCLLVTGVCVYGAVHYRLPLLWIGGTAAIGTVIAVMCLVATRFHRNVSRVLVDVNHSLPKGCFQRGGGIHCQLPMQSWLLAVFNLVPMAVVVLWGVISAWLISSLRELLGAALVDQLVRGLTSGIDSPLSMYGAELLDLLLLVACYALAALLYARYVHAHDERVPLHWRTGEAA